MNQPKILVCLAFCFLLAGFLLGIAIEKRVLTKSRPTAIIYLGQNPSGDLAGLNFSIRQALGEVEKLNQQGYDVKFSPSENVEYFHDEPRCGVYADGKLITPCRIEPIWYTTRQLR